MASTVYCLIGSPHNLSVDLGQSESQLSRAPQGSHLCPILPIRTFHWWPTRLSGKSQLSNICRDVKIVGQISSMHDAFVPQRAIDFLAKWSQTNSCRFNRERCKIVSFYPGRSSIVPQIVFFWDNHICISWHNIWPRCNLWFTTFIQLPNRFDIKWGQHHTSLHQRNYFWFFQYTVYYAPL